MSEVIQPGCSFLYSNCMVPTHPGKLWIVMEFKKDIYQAWKVMENDCGHRKSLKSHGIQPVGHDHVRSLTVKLKEYKIYNI